MPAGKRASTYEIPEYVAEAAAFAEPTQAAIEAADPINPGVQPRPAPASSSSASPSSRTSAPRSRRTISAAIAGQITVDEALNKGQQLAESTVTAKYKK